MGSIRDKNGKLFFDFRYRGVRCREHTTLANTVPNRKRMQSMLSRIDAEITLGTFEYSKYFPGSHHATKFSASAPVGSNKAHSVTPLYSEFAETWYTESEPLWRRSHRATIRSTLDRHLVPEFGHLAVAEITKADCLAFRARLAKLPGRCGHETLSAKTINRITTCKGSLKHHHHEPGGLLTHSVEVMEIAGDMAGARLSPLEKAITQVAALLHDLGKLRAVGPGSVRPTHYLLVSHESQTTRMLDPHLEWLRARSPQIAAGLDYTLEFLAQHPAERGRALFLAGDVVCAADRMSAALDNHKDLDNLLAKTLPVQQPKTLETTSAHVRKSRPRTDATDHRHGIVARRETNISHRASRPPNNNTQEGPVPWI